MLCFAFLNIETKAKDKESVAIERLKTSIKSCPELDKQLVQKFGKDYSVDEDNVKVELRKNANMLNPSDCKCKISTYIINELAKTQTK